jgi:ATP dependent DNA ligase domain
VEHICRESLLLESPKLPHQNDVRHHRSAVAWTWPGEPSSQTLLFRRRQWVFIAFDLLYLNGKDLRTLPLIERKTALKKLLRRKRSRILYLDHVESDGRLLFDQIVAMDLEGIVCKRKDSPYKVTEKPSRHWIKVKNPRYSQLEGGEELFERV